MPSGIVGPAEKKKHLRAYTVKDYVTCPAHLHNTDPVPRTVSGLGATGSGLVLWAEICRVSQLMNYSAGVENIVFSICFLQFEALDRLRNVFQCHTGW